MQKLYNQYQQIENAIPGNIKTETSVTPENTVLFMRSGDFYAMMGSKVSEVRDIITIYPSIKDGISFFAVPTGAVKPYINELQAAGWNVAIAEENEQREKNLTEIV